LGAEEQLWPYLMALFVLKSPYIEKLILLHAAPVYTLTLVTGLLVAARAVHPLNVFIALRLLGLAKMSCLHTVILRKDY
jgi:hypothetical protein